MPNDEHCSECAFRGFPEMCEGCCYFLAKNAPKPMTIEEIDTAMHRLSLQDWFKTEFDDYYYHVTLPGLTNKHFMTFDSLKIYYQLFGV